MSTPVYIFTCFSSIYTFSFFCQPPLLDRRSRSSLKFPISKQEKEFEEFTPWLQNKFEIKANRSWAMIILFHSYDERDAITEFFNLLEEFKNRPG